MVCDLTKQSFLMQLIMWKIRLGQTFFSICFVAKQPAISPQQSRVKARHKHNARAVDSVLQCMICLPVCILEDCDTSLPVCYYSAKLWTKATFCIHVQEQIVEFLKMTILFSFRLMMQQDGKGADLKS